MQHNSQKSQGPGLEQPPISNVPSGSSDTVPAWHTRGSQYTAHWSSLFEWFQAATFSPNRIATPWSRPATGYILAILGQLVAIAIIDQLSRIFPALPFCESLLLLVIFLIALGWGIGPALLATCTGALALLILWQHSPSSSAMVSQIETVLRFILYIGIALTLSILTNRTQQARYTAQALGQRLEEIIDTLPDPLVFYNTQGMPIYYNKIARENKSPDLPDLPVTQMPKLLGLHYSNDKQTTISDLPLMRALQGETVKGVEMRYHPFNTAAERTISVSATPLRARPDSSIIGAVTLTHDLSALRKAEREATKRAQQLEAVFDAITDAVFSYDEQDGVPYLNRAAWDLLGLTAEKQGDVLPDVPLYSLLDEQGNVLPQEEWPTARVWRGERLQGDQAIDVLLRRNDGQTRFVSVTGGPIYDAEQKVVGVVTVVRDVTERREVVQRAHASEHEAAERGRQLEATFNAMTDGVVIYDSEGRMLRVNNAYSNLIALDKAPQHTSIPPAQRGAILALRDEYGHPLNGPQQPVQRMLAGEIFTANRALDIQVRALDGRELQLNVTGTPMYDKEQHLTGGVLIFRDVTRRRALERRTQEALEALLTMATELVHLPEHTESQEAATKVSGGVSKPLAELIRRVLGCQRVSLTRLDQQTDTWHSLAVVGLSPEQEKLWYERDSGFNLRKLLPDNIFADEQQINGPVVLDFTQPLLSNHPNPFGIQTMILAPMKIGTHLSGMLGMDYGNSAHSYTPGELTLTKAVADLSALVIERERLQHEQAEAQANVLALHETNRMMDEFIGIAGHELRTPLTTIKASVQLANRQVNRLLQQPDALPATLDKQLSIVKGHLNRTERQIGMQNRLVSDLLDISRIHADRLELHPELCDLAALIREVIEDQHYLTPQRTLELKLSTPDEILVLADADRIRQVVSNYLSNALKYSEASKPVQVNVDLLDTLVCVAVRDEGPGLTLEQQQHIWARFYRAPGIEVRTGSGVGLGLGLHISRMIIERHNGQLGVDSEPGHGSTFWFTLPLLEQKPT